MNENKRREWVDKHQGYELNWWKSRFNHRIELDEQTRKRCMDEAVNLHGLSLKDYYDKTILDLGSGPRSMCEMFEGASLILIEPLANQFREFNNGAYNFPNIKKVFSVDAEKFLPELENTIDFVWCHSVLNHCWGWKQILDNVWSYLKKGGSFFIRSRVCETPHAGHPGIETRECLIDYMKEKGADITYLHYKPDEGKPSELLSFRGTK